MARNAVQHLTGNERFFGENEIIVSKTDPKGWITYANETFLKVAGYSEEETLGQPHSLIRHPDMPRCVFRLLWDTIQAGDEIFAYVINRAKNGDHYWVFAHVTPSFGGNGDIVGYHSNRRVPDRDIVDGVITPLYRQLCDVERSAPGPKEGMARSTATMLGILEDQGVGYDEWVLTL